MGDDITDIVSYYNQDPEREHRRPEEHQLEHELTWRYLERYLPQHGSILEIGAASGRHTVALAGRGYTVTAVDLSSVLLARCQEAVAAAGLEDRVRTIVADARDLGEVSDGDFDAVLLMGPLYHLIDPVDHPHPQVTSKTTP